MAVRVYRANVGGAEPLAAAARFHTDCLPDIETMLASGESIVIRFDHAEEKPHRWRREAVAALARKYAPLRVNALAPAVPLVDEEHITETVAFLIDNEGVTGQLLLVA